MLALPNTIAHHPPLTPSALSLLITACPHLHNPTSPTPARSLLTLRPSVDCLSPPKTPRHQPSLRRCVLCPSRYVTPPSSTGRPVPHAVLPRSDIVT